MAIRKVTARNSMFLAAAKRVFNKPVYRALSEIMNGPEPGETAAGYLRLRGLPDPVAFLQKRAAERTGDGGQMKVPPNSAVYVVHDGDGKFQAHAGGVGAGATGTRGGAAMKRRNAPFLGVVGKAPPVAVDRKHIRDPRRFGRYGGAMCNGKALTAPCYEDGETITMATCCPRCWGIYKSRQQKKGATS